jgi:sugar lactone lactonase YvrE
VKAVASGLEGPFGLGAGLGRLYVAESGDGQITRIDPKTGRTAVVARGLPSPAGVDKVGRSLAIVTGGAEDPNTKGDATLFVQGPHGRRHKLANLEKYELRHNPDGQTQFDPESGEPLDALSNPFAVLGRRGPGFVFVADAGANAVLSVTRSGKVSTFFVPPLVTTGACQDAPNNHPNDPKGCDPVPTGLAYGPRNRLYVSTLSAEVEGEGRVYVLNGRTGKVVDVIGGFTAPTGVAVSRDGTVYVSELLHNAPPGEPPPGFDPSTVGRIVRVAPNGSRTYAAVTMPVGLTWHQGNLYSTAWSVAGLFLGIPDAGQVVKVRPSAFR